MRATLWSEYDQYYRDEPVHVRFTLENLSDADVVVESDHPSKPAIDMYFIDTERRWSIGAGASQASNRLIIPPHGQHTIEWTLPPFPQADIYFLFGVWGSLNEEVRLSICYDFGRCD
ncbi:MAG: hypothetical protein H0T73_04790 [Ardenticatenales bacterium]|nr:hypothetical protein [Ardenticatenales bacterium]